MPLRQMAKKGAKALTNYDSLVSSANVADAPLSGGAVAAGAAAIGGSYAASTMGETTDSVGTPVLSSANPIDFAQNTIQNTVGSMALGAAGMSVGQHTKPGFGSVEMNMSPLPGQTQVSAMAGVGVAGGLAGMYAARGALDAVSETTAGKNIFDAPEASSRKSTSYLKRQLSAAGNAAYRSVGPIARGATFVASGAAAVNLVDETVTRLAKKVMKTGTPGSNLSSNNVLDSQKRVKQTGPTTGVSTYAGKSPNVMDGSTVLALHKTGGTGGVLR